MSRIRLIPAAAVFGPGVSVPARLKSRMPVPVILAGAPSAQAPQPTIMATGCETVSAGQAGKTASSTRWTRCHSSAPPKDESFTSGDATTTRVSLSPADSKKLIQASPPSMILPVTRPCFRIWGRVGSGPEAGIAAGKAASDAGGAMTIGPPPGGSGETAGMTGRDGGAAAVSLFSTGPAIRPRRTRRQCRRRPMRSNSHAPA